MRSTKVNVPIEVGDIIYKDGYYKVIGFLLCPTGILLRVSDLNGRTLNLSPNNSAKVYSTNETQDEMWADIQQDAKTRREAWEREENERH